jgi:peptidoglycan hydrolase-like protein with peptidoglycan-binding domain
MRAAVRGGLVLALIVAVGYAVWLGRGAVPRAATPPVAQVSTTTAQITQGDVVRRVSVAGTVGYDGHYQVVTHLPAGVLTQLPEPGTVAKRGDRLFAVAGTEAVLFYGTVPAYREFAAGMRDGADVRQLEENLVALGADPRHAIRVDNHFATATAAAIRRWQAAAGVPAADRTQTVPLGRVVFLPAAVRVREVPVNVGGSVGPGQPVLSATSTTPVVTVPVGADQQQLVHVGDAVQVSLPTGEPVAGKVTRVSQVAAAPSQPPPGTSSNPTVTVTVAVDLPAGVGGLDQAPVQVQITVEQHKGVLMVPVTALLSAAGGYQMTVVTDGLRRLVDVQPGLFDDDAGTVEVTGAGLVEGMAVEVPVS